MEQAEGDKIEYRVWNPFRSKLAASILAGVDNIYIKPGCKVMYLGAASGALWKSLYCYIVELSALVIGLCSACAHEWGLVCDRLVLQ